MTVGLRRKTRNFYNGEKFRRTRKELTNESEKKRKGLKMTGHFYNEKDRRTRKSTVGLAKN